MICTIRSVLVPSVFYFLVFQLYLGAIVMIKASDEVITNRNFNDNQIVDVDHDATANVKNTDGEQDKNVIAIVDDESLTNIEQQQEQDFIDIDDRTYLDIFGEVAKEFLTKKMIPISDPECYWNYKRCRCEPYCLCSFQPKLGDLHLSRTCRLNITKGETCHSDEEDIVSSTFIPYIPPAIQNAIHKAHEKSLEKLDHFTDKVESIHGKIQDNVCQELKTRCNLKTDHERRASEPREDHPRWQQSTDSPVFAWQERLLCRDIVQECKQKDNS